MSNGYSVSCTCHHSICLVNGSFDAHEYKGTRYHRFVIVHHNGCPNLDPRDLSQGEIELPIR
jgi:hypothetical protein